jgi:hypothetical protein
MARPYSRTETADLLKLVAAPVLLLVAGYQAECATLNFHDKGTRH